jgi:hypothetical protein
LSGVTLRERIKSEEIRKRWKVEEMIDDIQDYQLKWNQHVLRMPENRIPRKALQYRPQGIRDLGRPVHVVAERELSTKLRMEEEEEKEEKLRKRRKTLGLL